MVLMQTTGFRTVAKDVELSFACAVACEIFARRHGVVSSKRGITQWCFAVLLVVLGATSATAGPIRYSRWTPGVLTASQSAPMVLEAMTFSTISSVVLELNDDLTGPFSRPLRDDGQFGDRVAGDKIFSIQLSPAELRAWYDSTGAAARRFRQLTIGALKTFSSSGESLGSVSVGVPVLSDAVPAVHVEKIGHTLQYTPHVVNLSVPLTQFSTTQDSAVTSIFYQYFKDSFDFLSVVYDGSRYQNRHFLRAQNSISGIGYSQSGLGDEWGSAGRLQGLTVFPNGTLFATTQACADGYLHELGHRWINNLAGGMDDLYGFHWPLSDLAGGIMGYSAHLPDGSPGEGFSMQGPTMLEGNTMQFGAWYACPEYADLELYLMGLLDGGEVANHLVAADQDQLVVNRSFQGPFNVVSIQDVIAANGPRMPTAAQAQRSFRSATILVTPDTLASPEVMHYYENEALYAEAVFDRATGKRGQLRSEVDTERRTLALPGVKILRVRNAASLASGPVAPGEIIRIDGTLLASEDVTAVLQPEIEAPKILGGTRVLINGQAIPLLAVRPREIIAVVPSTLTNGNGAAIFQVQRHTNSLAFTSNPFSVAMARVSPSIFVVDGLGIGMAEAYGPHGDLITNENIVMPGTEVTVYVQGVGPFIRPLPDGSLVPARGAPALANSVDVFVGGVQATVTSAQAIPGDLANKAAIRFVVPSGFSANGGKRQPEIYIVIAKRASQDGVVTGVFVP